MIKIMKIHWVDVHGKLLHDDRLPTNSTDCYWEQFLDQELISYRCSFYCCRCCCCSCWGDLDKNNPRLRRFKSDLWMKFVRIVPQINTHWLTESGILILRTSHIQDGSHDVISRCHLLREHTKRLYRHLSGRQFLIYTDSTFVLVSVCRPTWDW